MATGGPAELTAAPAAASPNARRMPRPVRELVGTVVLLALFLVVSAVALAVLKSAVDRREDRWLLETAVETGLTACRDGRMDDAEAHLLLVARTRPRLTPALADETAPYLPVLPRFRAHLRERGVEPAALRPRPLIEAKAAALSPAPESDYAAALLALRDGDLATAEDRLRRDWTRRPDSADAAFLLGVIAERRNDRETAKAWYARAFTHREDHRDAAAAYLALAAPETEAPRS